MQFLYPPFLWGLLALSIPIIIHLFYFRRFKKVSFTNVRLLKEIKEETSSRNKLKDLIILAMRLLALAFLIFAFAQPFIPRGEDVKQGNNAVSIFIDNSFSMSSTNNQIPILDIAKERAREIIRAYSNSDNYQILTQDFEGRHQRLVSQEDALSLIDEINISPAVQSISSVVNRQFQTLTREDANRISYVISDFQESIISGEMPSDSTIEVNLVPIASVQENNVAIDSVWLEAGVAFQGQTNKLLVRVKNHGEETVENVRLSIAYSGQEKPEGRLTIPAGNTITDTINYSVFNTGWQTAEVKISDFPVQFDDSYWISFYVEEEIDILVINSGPANRYLNAFFNGLPAFNVTTSTPNSVNFGSLTDYNLVIIHDITSMSTGMQSSITDYISNGGKLLFFPSINANLENINNFLTANGSNQIRNYLERERRVSSINTEEFIFNDVFIDNRGNLTLPTVSGSYEISSFQSRAEERLMTYRDGGSFLGKYIKGNGILYLCSSTLDPDINNLVVNAEVFVPMIFKMAIAQPFASPISYTIGSNDPIEVKRNISGGDIVYKIEGATEFIPSQLNLGPRILLNDGDQINTSGIYDLKIEDQLVKKLAYNYDRTESNLKVADLSEAKLPYRVMQNNLSADLTSVITEKDKGITLWKWCLILSLVFFAVESLLLRLWKK
ncbi:MAG: hypothetical protein HKN68_21160 [Saprospiraceae bacterium]|nr:hypothetical protein [Saprospiraceae bacterium]